LPLKTLALYIYRLRPEKHNAIQPTIIRNLFFLQSEMWQRICS
jgi:hypothetical protein